METYDLDDYILIDQKGRVQGVSGNTDFWDMVESMPRVNPNGTYTIAKVVVTQRAGAFGGITRQESEED
jgi:hypothetical protein